VIYLLNSIAKILAIDCYMSNLVKSERIGSRVGILATELAHKSSNQLIADSKSPKALAAAYLYFSAILLGVVNMPLSSLAGITDFEIRSKCKDLLTSFKIRIKVKPLIAN
jgi:transcription initiation factor TFIIB